MVAQLLPPVVTAIGRYGVPYLFKEYIKKGATEFGNVYGSSALQSINTLGAQNQDLFNQEFANYDDDKDSEEDKTPTLFDKDETKQPQQQPPKDPDPGYPFDPEFELSKRTTEEVIRQTKELEKKYKEPKVEFGPLTETEKQTARALMGDQPEFFSRVAKSIKDAKPNKLTKNKWKSYIQGDKQELKFLGLDKFLQGNESITKQELLDFVDQTNFASKLKVVEVPLEDQYDFSQYSIGGAGGKRAVAMQESGGYGLYKDNKTGYRSTVEQYVFQVDNISFDEEGKVKELNVGDADTAHFPLKYAKNAIAHARAQTGYFDADAVEKRLNAKEADGVKLSNDDKILKSASRQLEDTFIIDEIQSDAIQNIQKRGTKEDFIIIKGSDITSDFLKKFYPNYLVKKEPNILPGPGIFSPGFRGGPIAGLSETEPTNKKILDKAQNFANENQNVLYSVDPDRDITSERGVAEVRLMDNNFYVFDKETLVTKGSYKTEEAAQELIDNRGLNPLPITESKKYVELVLNAMIKKAVEKDLDSIGITNGQIQYDRYDGQPIEDKEGLKKFYDEIVFKQLEKVANKYGVELETVELPGKTGPKEFDDVGLNEPTEASDARAITRRTTRALRDGFVLRKIKYGVLAQTIENLMRGTVDGDPIGEDYIGGRENAILPDYASIFTRTGRGAGETFLDTLIDDNINEDINLDKEYYIWVKPDTKIDEAISRSNAGELASVARAWDIRNLNLQMPVSEVVPSGGTDINSYNSFISEYFDEKGPDLKYMHEIIKMRIPKELQKDILSKPIKLSKAKTQTDRLLA